MLQVIFSCFTCHKDVCNQSELPLEVFSGGGEAFDSALVNAWGRRNAIWETLVFKEALVGADECFCL